MNSGLSLFTALALSLCGCQTYQYRIVQPPAAAPERVTTVYDWDWKNGPARLPLTYERNGKTFEHNLEIVRGPVK